MTVKMSSSFLVCGLVSWVLASISVNRVASGGDGKWSRGEVMYTISSIFDDAQSKIIEDAMRAIQNNSGVRGHPCVRFLPETGDQAFASDYVQFTSSGSSDCIYDVGRQGGKQSIYLGDSCMTKTGMLPVLFGILGLNHEHRRPATNSSDVTIENTNKLCYGVMRLREMYTCDIETPKNNNSNIRQIRKSPSYVDCTYEQPFCNLVNDVIHNDSPWQKTKMGALNDFPVEDASSSNAGSYIYTSSNGSTLVTIRNIPAGNVCLELSYCDAQVTPLQGNNDATHGGFAVYAETYLRASLEICNGCSQASFCVWRKYTVTVKSAFTWRMLIRANLDAGRAIALDDISIVPGLCSNSSSNAIKTIDVTVT